MSAPAFGRDPIAGDAGSCCVMAAGLHRVATRLRAPLDASSPACLDYEPALIADDLDALATALLAHAELLREAVGLARTDPEGATTRVNTILGRSHARLARACGQQRSTAAP